LTYILGQTFETYHNIIHHIQIQTGYVNYEYVWFKERI